MKVFKPLLISGILLSATTGIAFAGECEQLWVARNSIFNNNGYCFGTRLGKSLFNNSDCYTKRAKLSRNERNRVAQLKRRERRLGCRVNTRLSYLPGGSNNTYSSPPPSSPPPSSGYSSPSPAPFRKYKCKFKCIGNSGTSKQYEGGGEVIVPARNSSAARGSVNTSKLCRKLGYDRTPYMGDGLSCWSTY